MTISRDIYTTVTSSLTLYDLQRMIRSTLERNFDAPVWISAEISEIKINRTGHCYLNLVEKGANEGAPRAEARAVIWRTAYSAISASFRAATNMSLAAGMGILARVVVTYHEVYGLSLQILEIDASYTIGDVERRRRETIARLQSEGAWDMNHELELNIPTLRIAVVSSPTAAGYQDFVRELSRSPYRFKVTLYASLMQGEEAVASVTQALYAIAEEENCYDVAVIIRGGGSTSDLALFDSYDIASLVAQYPLPILAGIGHDKDVSITDMVAHTSCKTPTAVATYLVERAMTQHNQIELLAEDIVSAAQAMLQQETIRMYRCTVDIERLALDTIRRKQSDIEVLRSAIYEQARKSIENQEHRLHDAARMTDSYSVDNILKMGFALLRHNNKIIASAKELERGSIIDIELTTNTISATITDIKSKR